MAKPYFGTTRPIAFAHRGGVFDGIENSMEAFERCVAMGYRYLETDVHLTKDGVVVAVHDPTLERTTDRAGRVRDLTWAEVSKAKIGGTATIPRLDDLLDAFPDVRLNIDAKVADVVTPLAELLVSRGRADLERVCLASFSDARIRKLRGLTGGAAAYSMGPAEIGRLRVASFSRRAQRYLPLPGDVAQVPVTVRGRRIVDRRFVQTAHDLGKQVHVWTIDDPDEMRRLLDLDVDAIMTDEPQVLKDVLIDRGQWHAA